MPLRFPERPIDTRGDRTFIEAMEDAVKNGVPDPQFGAA